MTLDGNYFVKNKKPKKNYLPNYASISSDPDQLKPKCWKNWMVLLLIRSVTQLKS